MVYKRKTIGAGIVFLLAGIVCHYAGGGCRAYGVPVFFMLLLGIFMVLLRASRTRSASGDSTQSMHDDALPRTAEKEVSSKTSGLGAEVLGAKYRRSRREEIEKSIDIILDDYIKLIRSRLDVHTVAVFFPKSDGGYKIRRFFSPCDYVNSNAVIYPGVGVIGSFLKDGLKQLNLQEIVTDSMTLYYYTKDAGIRSLMASPIVAEGIERGTVIVDSTEKKHFSDEDHAYLSRLASVLGHTVYYTYLYNEHRLQHQRLASMSSIEKDFFTNLDMDAILEKMVEIIPFAITCDRLTISLKADDADHAVIGRVCGHHTEELLGRSFSLHDKTLMGLLYTKNLCFFRNFSSHHYESRYYEEEPVHREFSSFLAFPFGVDECSGALLLESFHKDAFSESHRNLLSRLATSAGLAVEKIRILQRAETLATHDGLTGLINHRQFHLSLKDEISRANRYSESVGLVLCDIDFFKKVNDIHGHPFGDIVLKGVADRLKENIREGIDIAARYGGEEFALILGRSNTAHAMETAQRMREIIARTKYQDGRDEVGVTMSFGIAVYGEHANTVDSLIRKSDKALYRAKRSGRNRVEVF